MSHYTVLVIPEGTQSPRRFRVAHKALRRWMWVCGIGAALLLAVCADYVRVRFNVVELGQLRLETQAQRTHIDALSTTLTDVEGRLTELGELERKVRMIADLPPAVAGRTDGIIAVGGGNERRVEEPGESGEIGDAAATAVPTGNAASQGGTDGETSALEAPADPSGATERGAADGSPATTAPDAAAATLESRAAVLREKGTRLSARAAERQASFADLVGQLDSKRQLLASTPSIWPAQGWLTSRFGRRVSPFTGRRQLHAGIDIAAAPGTEIIAPARGRVVFAGYKGHMGRTIILDHGFRMRTTFGHARDLHGSECCLLEEGKGAQACVSTAHLFLRYVFLPQQGWEERAAAAAAVPWVSRRWTIRPCRPGT
ncbi:MAG: M23 family metallopeptidase [Deltaproteobacteria bacterium]|nr:MAG: M23 family metallopeptidase [Deltaproteobacteria bacterium]